MGHASSILFFLLKKIKIWPHLFEEMGRWPRLFQLIIRKGAGDSNLHSSFASWGEGDMATSILTFLSGGGEEMATSILLNLLEEEGRWPLPFWTCFLKETGRLSPPFFSFSFRRWRDGHPPTLLEEKETERLVWEAKERQRERATSILAILPWENGDMVTSPHS